jgi:hypothetical protein
MKNVARKLEDRGVYQEIGEVLRAEGPCFIVGTALGELRATRAVSCLVEPEPADRVLCAGAQGGACWILAVLEREQGAPARLVHDGDMRVELKEGRFSVAAQEGIDLASGKDVNVVAAGLNVNAVDGKLMLERLSFVGTFVRAEIEKVKVFAGTLDSVLDRFSQRVKRSYRFVEELDQVKAERVDYTAKTTMSLHGANTVVTAEELVKVDGSQIHLG